MTALYPGASGTGLIASGMLREHLMTMPAEDAYWFVAGDTTKVWSSARVAYVPTTDAAYQAWLAAGHTTIPVISEARAERRCSTTSGFRISRRSRPPPP